MATATELTRMRRTYAEREARLAGRDRYALTNESYLYYVQQRQRDILALLRQEGMLPLEGRRILEVGCGNGGVMLELLAAGAGASGLHGSDLLAERVRDAHATLPHLPLSCADGRNLPYADESFDLVLQFTVFSSILDEALCYTVAEEMLRVVRSQGLILWYDFWTNPTNRQTRGIRLEQIRRYFPGCRYTVRRITLAPPLARRMVPISWIGASLLEKLKLFNTHYLVGIRPNR